MNELGLIPPWNRLLIVLVLLGSAHSSQAEEISFQKQIAPILQGKCIKCHNEKDAKGGLSLSRHAQAIAGGESGEVIVPGDAQSSYLLELLVSDDGRPEMPKGEPALSADEVGKLRKWISEGAHWPEEIVIQPEKWWSLKPLQRPAIPKLPPAYQQWVRTPIDAFIAAQHTEKKITPAVEADRQTLIRRLSFDLIGLPPSPEEIDTFVKDPRPNAYEQLVDRLLASPQYGERWARHWLDVVHYGETHGYDKDKPRNNAWPYRDYVVRSLNEDKPYSRFIQEQVAGDVLFPGTVDGIEALGFLAAGPWDFIGHIEVPASKIDGKVARHLDRDDMVQTTFATFNSMTVGCAQCHNHKFDPIKQEDYYRLQAVFSALDRTDTLYYRDPQQLKDWQQLKSQQEKLAAEKTQLDGQLTKLTGGIWQSTDPKPKPGTYPPQHGYHSAISQTQDVVQWVQVDLGQPQAIDLIECVACYDDFKQIGPGFGFPIRFKVEVSDDPDFHSGIRVLLDQTQKDFPNPGLTPQTIDGGGQTGRYVRVTATKLASRFNDFIFALSELKVFDAAGKNLARGKTVTALTSIEAPIRWTKGNLVDGIHPLAPTNPSRLTAWEQLASSKSIESIPQDLKQRYPHLLTELASIDKQIKSMPSPSRVYVATIHNGSGNFRGTGPDGGRPRPIHLLNRGKITDPGELVRPGTLECIEALPGDFPLSLDSSDADRRAALANWLSDPRNPLTWRSIANRVWQYHFGQGLVASPNDFGRMGQKPTHPELLDWLAVELRDGKQSLKHLHRLIVTSATYRQMSTNEVSYAGIDQENHLYWRMNRRQLEAEAVRDSILSVAGQLNLTMGGPSFQDFVIEKPQHSPHYQYHLHNPNDPASHRRAIYRFLVRSQREPFMTAFNCADPSMQVATRNRTVTPQQSLSLLNNKLALAMAQAFAERLDAEGNTLEAKIERGFRLAIGRAPTAQEQTALVQYAQANGLPSACRVIFNLNEFVFVD